MSKPRNIPQHPAPSQSHLERVMPAFVFPRSSLAIAERASREYGAKCATLAADGTLVEPAAARDSLAGRKAKLTSNGLVRTIKHTDAARVTFTCGDSVTVRDFAVHYKLITE
jgi:hypothetical protein